MKIELRHIPIRELVKGYNDDGEGGVVGYGGRLDVRPPYQREFVYGEKQAKAVIETVQDGFPLNVMYWADNGGDRYEIIDGQQRTISIAEYIGWRDDPKRPFKGNMPIDGLFFQNLQADEQRSILDYELTVYVCTGTDKEKLKWFEKINIAGEELSRQELRNAVYSGVWVTNAKQYFSRKDGFGVRKGGGYLQGDWKRQDYLETAIKWAASVDDETENVDEYMGLRQHDESAEHLWLYFEKVIDWVESIFKYRREMKGLDWGGLYTAHKDATLDPAAIEDETQRLIADDDVERQKGIYAYLLDGDERHLRIRAFSPTMKRRAYEAQGGKCAACGDEFTLAQMEADHITPWRDKGATVQENCQVLCRDCNRRKGAK
ncbi:MAG: DUF262 domain-containing protein [Gemmatimonadales bacterium]|nr:DUF262 domain-containing protein [Gemmatimonadales bacterium]MYG20696.1 DUF262 domain-containing protein [Gemmatimonadales bacterium]